MASVLNDETKTSINMDQNMTTMKLSDCTCPICMYVLVEPVTMPCNHELCMTCFKQNVQESSLTCPMCRVRISTWARRAAKANKLINQERWSAIKKAFPQKVQNRIEGKDDYSSDEEMEVMVNLAEPGEIRKEYEEQLKRLEEERKQKERDELEASAQLIKQLQRQEMQEAERHQQELLQLAAKDAEIAKQLNSALNQSTSEELDQSTAEILKILEERSSSSTTDSRSSSWSGRSRHGSSVMDKFLAKGKRQQQSRADKDAYPYTCISPWQKEEEEKSESRNSGAKSEDQAIAASLLDIFGPPVPDSPEPTESLTEVDLPSAQEEDRGGTLQETKQKTPEGSMGPPIAPIQRELCHSEDSITQELVHFRPIHASPKTPPRRLPGGRTVEPKLIRSTPINLGRASSVLGETEQRGVCSPEQAGMQSPVMQRRLKQLATERQFQVAAQSKSTSTEPGQAVSLDHSYWSPSKKKLDKTVKCSALSEKPAPSHEAKIPISNLFKGKASATATVSSSSHVMPGTSEELPKLPDLPIDISDDEDEDVVVVKHILPLEHSLDEDMGLDLPPFGLQLLNSTVNFSYDNSQESEHSQSDKLYIADSQDDSQSVLWPVSASQSRSISGTNQSQLMTINPLLSVSASQSRPTSSVPSLFTSETLSSSRSNSADSKLGGVRQEVNLKVMDETARMGVEAGQGDSHSHLGLNVLQPGKLEEGLELHPASLHQVYTMPLGVSPTLPTRSSSRSSGSSRDPSLSSIKLWFQKWSDKAAASTDPDSSVNPTETVPPAPDGSLPQTQTVDSLMDNIKVKNPFPLEAKSTQSTCSTPTDASKAADDCAETRGSHYITTHTNISCKNNPDDKSVTRDNLDNKTEMVNVSTNVPDGSVPDSKTTNKKSSNPSKSITPKKTPSKVKQASKTTPVISPIKHQTTPNKKPNKKVKTSSKMKNSLLNKKTIVPPKVARKPHKVVSHSKSGEQNNNVPKRGRGRPPKAPKLRNNSVAFKSIESERTMGLQRVAATEMDIKNGESEKQKTAQPKQGRRRKPKTPKTTESSPRKTEPEQDEPDNKTGKQTCHRKRCQGQSQRVVASEETASPSKRIKSASTGVIETVATPKKTIKSPRKSGCTPSKLTTPKKTTFTSPGKTDLEDGVISLRNRESSRTPKKRKLSEREANDTDLAKATENEVKKTKVTQRTRKVSTASNASLDKEVVNVQRNPKNGSKNSRSTRASPRKRNLSSCSDHLELSKETGTPKKSRTLSTKGAGNRSAKKTSRVNGRKKPMKSSIKSTPEEKVKPKPGHSVSCTDGQHCNTPSDLDDKENELEDEVFFKTRNELAVEREAATKKSSCVTPKKRKNVFVEYTPGSGGKKLIIKKISNRKKSKNQAQTRLLFSSGDGDDDDDDDDFTDSPLVKKQKRAKKKAVKKPDSSGKQMTLLDMLSGGTSKHEAPSLKGEVPVPSSSTAPSDLSSDEEDIIDPDKKLDRSNFSSDAKYREHVEKLDMQIAMQLQAEYEFEAKYKLNCVRKKGTQNSYSFRRKSSRCKSK